MSHHVFAAPWRKRGAIGIALGLALLLAACEPTGANTTPTPTPKPTATATPNPPCTTWRVVPSPAAPLDEGLLTGVAALSPSQAWAVGNTYTMSSTGGQLAPLIEQWDGSSWRIVASPDTGGSGALSSVAAVSSQDVWAVGSSLIEHWNGTTWSIAPAPTSNGRSVNLSSVVALSATNVWAVGVWNDSPQLAAVRWDGTAWRVTAIPTPPGSDMTVQLAAAARVPGTNRLWAVGFTYDTTAEVSHPLIMQWDGSAWQFASLTLPNDQNWGELRSVVALSATNAWVVGTATQAGQSRTLIAHWDGASWKVEPTPDMLVVEVKGVAAVSANDVRAVGSYVVNYATGEVRPLIEQWDGSTWQTLEGPMPQGASSGYLNAIATDGAGGYWAVGSSSTTQGGRSHPFIIASCS